jgi:threonine synthase
MKINREMKFLCDLDSRLYHALNAAGILEDIMLYFYNREYEYSWDKSEKDPAASIKLEVDKKCDFLARTYLTSLYPISDKWGFIGEESFDNSERSKEFYWCVDPICGSLGYKKKTGNFGTSIALIHKGKAILGVMNCPTFGWTGMAVSDPKKIVAYSHKKKNKKKSSLRIIVSANRRDNPILLEILNSFGKVDITYAESLPVKSLGVLMGNFDLFYGMPETLGGGKYNIWDIAATSAFAEVEDIKLTDAFGEAIRLDMNDHRFYNGIIMTRDNDIWKKAVEITHEINNRTGKRNTRVPAIIIKKPTSFITKLKCVECGREYNERRGLLICPSCGESGILDVLYDYDAIKKVFSKESLKRNPDPSLWRYLPLLPVSNKKKIPNLRVGGSPIYNLRNLAKHIGVKKLIVKDDGINPTASLKDRASSVGVARAMAENARAITCASTGNAASSLAGSAASAGIPTFIFVPEKAPAAKVAQLMIFGANVFIVKGSYEDAFNLSMHCAKEFNFYNRNSGINPYLVEGKKTVSLEICEQLDWSVPDYVFVAVGDGCTIAGVHKGFMEMFTLGFITKIPVIVGVQAAGAAPVMKAWKSGRDMIPVHPRTMADSIAVGTPRNWRKAVKSVRESNGFYISVTDREILSAMKCLGNIAGIFGEPAGVCGLAGIIKARAKGLISGNVSVAAIVSGNGLKDASSAVKAAGKAKKISPDLSSLNRIIKRII